MSRGNQVPTSSPPNFAYVAITLCGRPFQVGSAIRRIGNSTGVGPTTPGHPCGPPGLGYFRFRSPLLSESRLLSFPPGTEMVHFPGFAPPPYGFRRRCSEFTRNGFPHSEISGSRAACASLELIAACHVLLRLLAPRHPPYALSSLTIKFTRSITPDRDTRSEQVQGATFGLLVLPYVFSCQRSAADLGRLLSEAPCGPRCRPPGPGRFAPTGWTVSKVAVFYPTITAGNL